MVQGMYGGREQGMGMMVGHVSMSGSVRGRVGNIRVTVKCK